MACLGTDNALPTDCATPNRTASGRVVGVGPKPIFQACIVAFGAKDTMLGLAITDADGRWKLSGLPINYDYIIGVVPSFRTRNGPCAGDDDDDDDNDNGPQAPPPGALQPEFFDDTWADLSDRNLREDPLAWATDPDSPHPAVTLRNNRTGIDVCITTEMGRDTERGSCDPTPTATASATASQPTLAATGGPSPLTPTLVAALLLGAGGLLARSRSIGRR